MARLLKLIGGLALAGLAYKNRDKVTGLLGGGTSAPEPYTAPGPAPAPPAPANVDVAGPPANTATAVPAPEPVVHDPAGGIDELAEEEAAAAEAANIGGPAPGYPDTEGEDILADPASAPLEEAGGGVSEGEELAEADLVDNAGPAAGDPVEGERAVEAAIAAQDDPAAGEELSGDAVSEPAPNEPPPPPTGPPVDLAPPPLPDPPADEKSTAVWKSEEQPTVDLPRVKPEDGSS